MKIPPLKTPPLPPFAAVPPPDDPDQTGGDKVTLIGAGPDGQPIYSVATSAGRAVRWADQKRAQVWRSQMETALDCLIFFR